MTKPKAPVSKFVPAQDLVVPYPATDLAPRLRLRMFYAWMTMKLEDASCGIIGDIELTETVTEEDMLSKR